jgi:hypothetical protein
MEGDLLAGLMAAGAGLMVFIFILVAFLIVCQWKIFTKAGQPGWAVLVPFYNLYVYTQVIKRPKWWMLLYFSSIIPVVGSLVVLVISIMDTHRLSTSFGKGGGFTAGLIFLGIIFYPILAFGSAEYQSDDAAPAATEA